MTTKHCNKCSTTRELSDFHKDKGKKDGHSYICKHCALAVVAKYSKKNQDKVKAYQKKYYADNQDKAKARAAKWQKDNPDRVNAKNAKRKAKRLNATPEWLTPDQLSEIQQHYWLAKDLQAVTGEVYHVDHIVPLQGENVCGLHVPWNLQVLPADINISKGNRYEEV